MRTMNLTFEDHQFEMLEELKKREIKKSGIKISWERFVLQSIVRRAQAK